MANEALGILPSPADFTVLILSLSLAGATQTLPPFNVGAFKMLIKRWGVSPSPGSLVESQDLQ